MKIYGGNSSRSALIMSAMSFILCVSMLLGTTYAWFTEEVTSGVNQIIAGNLDVELTHRTKSEGAAIAVTSTTDNLFATSSGTLQPDGTVWETFTVTNNGSLALKYQFSLTKGAVTGEDLTNVIKIAYTTDELTEGTDNYANLTFIDWTELPIVSSKLLNKNNHDTFTIVLKFDGNTDDVNTYQGSTVNIGVRLVASQLSDESDSFDSLYDIGATVSSWSESTALTASAGIVAGYPTTLTVNSTPAEGAGNTTVTFPANSLTGSNASLAVIMQDSAEAFAITHQDGTVAALDFDLNVDRTHKTDGFTATITTYIATGLSGVSVHYNGTEDQPTNVSYNSDTGALTFTTSHFSTFYVTTTSTAVIGNTGYATLDDALVYAVANDTVTLLRDCDTGTHTKGTAGTYETDPLRVSKAGLTLDLNGHTITVNNNFSFVVGANDVTVKNGKITSAANAEKKTGINSYVLVVNNCTGAVLEDLVMTGGVSVGGDQSAWRDVNVNYAAPEETPVYGHAGGATATLRNCNVTSGDYYAVCSQMGSTVTIESGTYVSNQTVTNESVGNLSPGVVYGDFNGSDGPEGYIYITGGEFDGAIPADNVGWIHITGGTFSADPANFVDSVHYSVSSVTVDSKTTYTVTKK